MSGIPTLETERLRLRPFRLEDAADVQRLAGERVIAETTLLIPHPYPDGAAEAWIALHQPNYTNGTGITFAITRKPDGALLGAISLMRMEPGHQAELAYWVGQPFWGCGFCTEAGAAVLRYAFSELGLARVHASHFGRNPASGRVMQKLGLRPEGLRRQHIRKWDRCDDLMEYGILKTEHLETAGGGKDSNSHFEERGCVGDQPQRADRP